MELKHVQGNVYYIPNPANIGAIKGDNGVILIDTGIDDDTARKILNTLNKNDLELTAIINTHSHGDHYGGNHFIKKRIGVPIYASNFESQVIENSYIEPYYLFSGAKPIKELENKFLMGKSTKVDEVLEGGETFIDGVNLEVYLLPGHSPNQIGVKVDGVFFIGDAYFSTEAIEKHKLPFYIDIEKQLETLDFLKAENDSNKCDYFVPGHGKLKQDISKEIEINKKAINSTKALIKELLKEEKTEEELLKTVFEEYNIELTLVYHYYLMRTIIMAYLSYLYDKKEIDIFLKNGIIHWKNTDDDN